MIYAITQDTMDFGDAYQLPDEGFAENADRIFNNVEELIANLNTDEISDTCCFRYIPDAIAEKSEPTGPDPYNAITQIRALLFNYKKFRHLGYENCLNSIEDICKEFE